MTHSEAPAFQVGQLVRWTSASRGVWRHHVGIVVSVVPPGGLVDAHVPSGEWIFRFRHGGTRREVSYLVALSADRSKSGAGALYWPRTRHLASYGDEPSKPAVATPPIGVAHVVRAINDARDQALDLQLESLAMDLRPAPSRRAAHLALIVVVVALAIALVIGVFRLFPVAP